MTVTAILLAIFKNIVYHVGIGVPKLLCTNNWIKIPGGFPAYPGHTYIHTYYIHIYIHTYILFKWIYYLHMKATGWFHASKKLAIIRLTLVTMTVVECSHK